MGQDITYNFIVYTLGLDYNNFLNLFFGSFEGKVSLLLTFSFPINVLGAALFSDRTTLRNKVKMMASRKDLEKYSATLQAEWQ